MKYITEILEEANKDINSIKAHVGNNYLRNLMECAYLPERKLPLPEGEPPYTKNSLHESQLAGALWQIAKKMDVMLRKDIKPIQRERVFIQAPESVDAKSAKLLMAVKDQNIPTLYPSLTYQALVEVGYFKE